MFIDHGSWFIAYRYFIARWINYLAILAVGVAVTANIIVVCVMSGFLRETQRAIQGVHGDLTIQSRFDIRNYEETVESIRDVEGVAGAAPYVEAVCMAAFTVKRDGNEVRIPCQFKGIQPAAEFQVNRLEEYLRNGSGNRGPLPTLEPAEVPDSPTPDKEYPSLWVGDKYYSTYNPVTRRDVNNFQINDLVTIHTVPMGRELKATRKTFRVAGFFNSGLWEVDSRLLLIPLEWAQKLRKAEGHVDGISIKVEKGVHRQEVRKRLKNMNPLWTVTSWEEMESVVYGNAKFQAKMMAFIMFFFLIVTGFMTLAILTMIVYQKFREIGILKALGTTGGTVVCIFVLNGFFIGFFGLILGGVGGVLVNSYINPICNTIESWTGYEVFPTDVYYMDHVPIAYSPGMLMLVSAVALLVSTGAAVLPALRAGAMDPVTALRYE